MQTYWKVHGEHLFHVEYIIKNCNLIEFLTRRWSTVANQKTEKKYCKLSILKFQFVH